MFLGLGIPLFIFSLFSAALFNKMRKVNKYTGIIQQAFGLIMIVTAILIFTNYDKAIQVKVLNLFPGYSRFLGQFENNGRLQIELDTLAAAVRRALLRIMASYCLTGDWRRNLRVLPGGLIRRRHYP